VNVELRIEELVLHGFPPGDHHRIGDAVQLELSRLFNERGVPPSLVQGLQEIPQVDGGTLEIPRRPTSNAVGAQVARALYGGLDLRTGERPVSRTRERRGP
jgi:hypothetical protein